jgi:hypothetical protein
VIEPVCLFAGQMRGGDGQGLMSGW